MYYADDAVGGAVTYNTAVGTYALQGSITAANNTGTSNTAFGRESLESVSSSIDALSLTVSEKWGETVESEREDESDY